MKIRISFELDCSVSPSHDGENKQEAGEAIQNIMDDLSELYKQTPIRKLDLLTKKDTMSPDEYDIRMKCIEEDDALWKQIFKKFHIDGQFSNSKTFTYDCEWGKIGQGVQLVK